MLDIDNSPAHKRKDRSIYRHSWSSDEPSSSSNSVISGKEPKVSLWSKLRKQASRIHSSPSQSQGQDQQGQMPASGLFSSQPAAAASRGPGAYSLDQPRALAMAGNHNAAPAPRDILRHTMTSHLPTAGNARANSLLRGSGGGAAARPSTPHQSRLQTHSASMDILRSEFRMSIDAQPAPDHRDPQSITADSIRRTLGAYTGKTEPKGKPRLRRLMMMPSERRTSAATPANFIEGHPAAGLARIAEDDEQQAFAAVGVTQTSPISGSRLAPAFRVDAKRFSENSGSTVSSSDTTVAESPEPLRLRPRSPRLSIGSIGRPLAVYDDASSGLPPSPTREHPPKLLPMVHGQAALPKDLALDPVVYRNTFFNARPLNDHQQIESAIKKHGAYRPLSKSASDETLGVHRSPLRLSSANTPSSVRFCDKPETIPTPGCDEGDDDDADCERQHSASMPVLSAAKPAIARQSRRPSEPTRPTWWTAPSPQSSPAAADAEFSRRLQLELAALKRTVRTLQLQNDVLSDLASVDPVDNIPESVRTRMRTLELENLWLKNELRRTRTNQPKLKQLGSP